jgi:RNA polymerase-binding transcription factor DksA
VDTKQIKSKLIGLKKVLSERVMRTHHHIYEREKPISAKFSEQSIELDNQALVMALDAEGKEELLQIDKALDRLEQGIYGICLACDKEISSERLEILPFTSNCIDCAT